MEKRIAIASAFSHDKQTEGWLLLEDVKEPREIEFSRLRTISFLKRAENYILGEEMQRRARKRRANLGQRHAEALLLHQEEISPRWRKYYLIFPGTLWETPVGIVLPYLYWSNGSWHLDFHLFHVNWYVSYRLVQAVSVS